MALASTTLMITVLGNPATLLAVPVDGEGECKKEMIAYSEQFENRQAINNKGDSMSFTVQSMGGGTIRFYLRCQSRG